MTTQSDTVRSREIRLASRPSGEPTGANFSLASADVGPPGDGELLVKNTLMSVEPYMRGRMNDAKSYVPPFALGEPLTGAAVGTVLVSHVPEIPAGATVLHDRGWREHAVVRAKSARVIDTSGVPAETYLGALGTTGFTAWVGLRVVADVQAGETIFVSAAAGAVGSMAVQLGELRRESARRARGVRRRRGVRLSRRRARAAAGPRSGRYRRIFRQRRRRAARSRDRRGARPRASRAVRRDLAVQRIRRGTAAGPAQPVHGDREALALTRVHRHRPPRALP